MEVKRYTFDARWAPEVVHVNDYMVLHGDGEWMKYADHEVAMKEAVADAFSWEEQCEIARDLALKLGDRIDSLSTRHARAIEALRGCVEALADLEQSGRPEESSAWGLCPDCDAWIQRGEKHKDDCELFKTLAAARVVLGEEAKG